VHFALRLSGTVDVVGFVKSHHTDDSSASLLLAKGQEWRPYDEGGAHTASDVEPLKQRVQCVRCFRGIDDLTALTIATEIGDPRRFATGPCTMAFVGLVRHANERNCLVYPR
jgi:hypothetical protein